MHLATALYLKPFDFCSWDAPTACELMIAATPRSGSTAFCLDLWRTGCLGAPLEYANFAALRLIPRWVHEIEDRMAYWQKIKSLRTGSNGVFSYKFFVHQYYDLAITDPRMLKHIAPDYVIYITRRDLLGQAISYSKAIRTGQWFADVVNDGDGLVLDAEDVRQRYMALKSQMRRWEQVFQLTGVDPLRVTYEDFLADPSAVMRRCVSHVLGPSAQMMELDIPRFKIQRDSQTETWRNILRHIEPAWNGST